MSAVDVATLARPGVPRVRVGSRGARSAFYREHPAFRVVADGQCDFAPNIADSRQGDRAGEAARIARRRRARRRESRIDQWIDRHGPAISRDEARGAAAMGHVVAFSPVAWHRSGRVVRATSAATRRAGPAADVPRSGAITWPAGRCCSARHTWAPTPGAPTSPNCDRRRLPWLHGYPSLLALLAGLPRRASGDARLRRALGDDRRREPPARAGRCDRARVRCAAAAALRHGGRRRQCVRVPERPAACGRGFCLHGIRPRRRHGAGYRIVGTNVTNRAFPLIRYDVGDIAQVSGQTCDCGRPGRIIDRIDGRREDYVVLPSGALVGRLDHIFKDQVRVREAQIYQPDRSACRASARAAEGLHHAGRAAPLTTARIWLGTDLRIEVEHLDVTASHGRGKVAISSSQHVTGGTSRERQPRRSAPRETDRAVDANRRGERSGRSAAAARRPGRARADGRVADLGRHRASGHSSSPKASLVDKARSRPDLVKQVIEKVRRDGLVRTAMSRSTRLDRPVAPGYADGRDGHGCRAGRRLTSSSAIAWRARARPTPPTPRSTTCPRTSWCPCRARRPGEQVGFDEAAFTTLGAIALHGVRLGAPAAWATAPWSSVSA